MKRPHFHTRGRGGHRKLAPQTAFLVSKRRRRLGRPTRPTSQTAKRAEQLLCIASGEREKCSCIHLTQAHEPHFIPFHSIARSKKGANERAGLKLVCPSVPPSVGLTRENGRCRRARCESVAARRPARGRDERNHVGIRAKHRNPGQIQASFLSKYVFSLLNDEVRFFLTHCLEAFVR